MTKTARTTIRAYVLLLPAFLITLAFMVYPLYITLNMSFRAGPAMSFSKIHETPFSLDNYQSVFGNPETWRSLKTAIVYTIGSTALGFFLGLGTALLLNKRRFARRILRILVLLPWSVPGVVAAISFLWILDSSYGIMNYFLRSSGIISSNLSWFFDPNLAMISVILPTVWKGYPFFTLTLLAAMQSIPDSLYEAGRVDGASKPKLFCYITWPGIRTQAVLSIVLNGLWTFRVFDIIYPTTGGGPLGATETLAIRIYNEAFRFYQMGKAATLGLLALVICGIFILSLYPLMKKRFF